MARSPTHKKLQLARAWASGHPVWCAWQVNYRCNFQCSFCHYWADPMGDQPELSVRDYWRGSHKLSRLGSLLISLAGGEPLIRPDIVEIVEAVARWHFPFITTNGWFVNEGLAEDLFDAGLWGVSISIDYADSDRHDEKRGVPGAYERALRAIELFSQARRHKWQRVNWMTVLMNDNLDQIEPMIRMAADRGAYFMVQPYGVRKTGSKRFAHAYNGMVGNYLLKLRRKYSNFLSNPHFLSQFDKALNGGVPGCQAGRGFFNIDSVGDIAACVEERNQPVANLFRDSAQEIVRHLRADETPRHCTACWYNCRGEIEALYNPRGVVRSLPTLLFDRGKPPRLRPALVPTGHQ
ncbi:MAG: radical SAM protein [Planctomycetota bacterium]